ncbi:peptidase inhibitor family I36 protein [Polyangium jinanense]|uniref:Peptidase inhibitor family I36 protein n=1 Tax=Polyangium jinanense TaxID=2829994 RepID=A0A9X3XIZ7_9BACT|nr:peptidase inhibitor family I36 protein [Polyangium jinanense]MDC3962931.1 peptidase inhibitor family I36 protein [Polyangium jinanense]MDC3989066.1 peptidase inhibitor family I36 protein [Polyangium jinanense]
MIKSMIVGLFALGAVCVASHADACAMFFENGNYGGRIVPISAERFRVPWIGNEWNDTISSIRVAPLCTVTVYEDVNFTGESLMVSADTPWLGDWNDRISSYICTCWP